MLQSWNPWFIGLFLPYFIFLTKSPILIVHLTTRSSFFLLVLYIELDSLYDKLPCLSRKILKMAFKLQKCNSFYGFKLERYTPNLGVFMDNLEPIVLGFVGM